MEDDDKIGNQPMGFLRIGKELSRDLDVKIIMIKLLSILFLPLCPKKLPYIKRNRLHWNWNENS